VKTLPLVAINVVTVVAALAAYDFLREPGGAVAPAPAADLGALEARVAMLEERPASREGARMDELADRLSHLERRMEEGPRRPGPPPREPDEGRGRLEGSEETRLAAENERAAALAARTAELERAVADAERRMTVGGRRADSRLDQVIKDRGLQLTDEQKEKVGSAMSTFRDKVRAAARKLRESGMGREGMQTAVADLRADLQTDLEAFLTPADAATIVEDMAKPPVGPGPGGGRRSPRSR
jgi:hypothetical protein